MPFNENIIIVNNNLNFDQWKSLKDCLLFSSYFQHLNNTKEKYNKLTLYQNDKTPLQRQRCYTRNLRLTWLNTGVKSKLVLCANNTGISFPFLSKSTSLLFLSFFLYIFLFSYTSYSTGGNTIGSSCFVNLLITLKVSLSLHLGTKLGLA